MGEFSFDPANPGAVLDQTISQATSNLSTVALWAFGVVLVLGLLTYRSGR